MAQFARITTVTQNMGSPTAMFQRERGVFPWSTSTAHDWSTSLLQVRGGLRTQAKKTKKKRAQGMFFMRPGKNVFSRSVHQC